MKTVLFDLDGTLADINQRRKFLEQDKPDWVNFNKGILEDQPNLPLVSLYQTLWNSREYTMILVTGRMEQLRSETLEWLQVNGLLFDALRMRRNGDYRPDHLVKEEMLDEMLQQGHSILFVVDDRQQVVDMWRQRGLTCLQCDVGDF